MERGRKWKALAFVPALVLVGAFVGCRSGAFQMFPKPEPRREPHPLGYNVPAPQPTANPTAPDARPVFIGGAKSPNFNVVKPSDVGLTPSEAGR